MYVEVSCATVCSPSSMHTTMWMALFAFSLSGPPSSTLNGQRAWRLLIAIVQASIDLSRWGAITLKCQLRVGQELSKSVRCVPCVSSRRHSLPEAQHVRREMGAQTLKHGHLDEKWTGNSRLNISEPSSVVPSLHLLICQHL